MASNSAERIVLLPIKPLYAEAIMIGSKKVEFRKARFDSEVLYAVVYASRPDREILGYFEVCDIVEDSPEALWARYHEVAGISQEDFQAYYASSTIGIAIEIGNVYPLRNPAPFTILGEALTPPQSFMYLTNEAFEMLRTKQFSEKGG